MKVNVWHRKNHDDYEVTELTVQDSMEEFVKELVKAGGLFDAWTFIPFHSISFIDYSIE
jgi:hypothetical protein